MLDNFNLTSCQNILIIAGSGGIAKALGIELEKRVGANIYQSFREDKNLISNQFKLNITIEEDWIKLSEQLKERKLFFDLVIHGGGLLHNERVRPEKSLRSITLEQMREVFEVNTFSVALAAKYLTPFMNKTMSSRLVFLSAMVGSSSENKLGGWYSYRASKAALNSLVKTMGIELDRKKSSCKALAIHPGTTHTKLSKPFSKNVKYKVKEASESAHLILDLIDRSGSFENGAFKNWDGRDIGY